jgi:hypothetical protein
MPTEQFDINTYIPALPKRTLVLKNYLKLQQQNNLIRVVIFWLDMDDFSAFEKISQRQETATDPNFQLTPGRDSILQKI